MICLAKFLLFGILLLGIITQISAGPGDLDPSFGVNGIVITDNSTGADNIEELAVQPDGKIIAVGLSGLARFNADGSLDSTFGTGGRIPFTNAWARSVAVQLDGKIVIAGEKVVGMVAEFPLRDFFIRRYNSDGSIDTTFNGSGTLVLDLHGGADDVGYSVKIQPDGKILVGGISCDQSIVYPMDYAIVRLNADGSLDTSFDSDGKIITRVSTGAGTRFGEIALKADGKIFATGTANNPSPGPSRITTVSYNADGSLNTAFDGDGIASTNELASGNSIALQSDGKILVAGGRGESTFLVRYNADGSPDTSFGTGGQTSLSNGSATDVEVQSDGKIVFTAINNNGYVVRVNANGSIDTTFHADGFSTILIPNSPPNAANAVTLQANGKILVGGFAGASDFRDFMVARFENACTVNCGPRIADFDGDGKTDISTFRPGNGEWWIKRSAATVIVYQFGVSTDRIVPGDYTGDGKADVAVWRGSTGEWFVLRSEDNSYYSFPFGTSGDVPVPADYDGDLKTDTAVFRPSTNVWYILRSSGGITINGFGSSGDLPVAADYDGDGKADIAIYRPSNGQWWLNRSTAGVIVYTFGVSTDKPIQGDYTGDGKADVAFWRPSTREWFILRSENASYYSFTWGIIGDTPSPGDYDGDGKYDPTVFRPSNASWWVNGTITGLQTTNFGTPGDAPVPSAFVP